MREKEMNIASVLGKELPRFRERYGVKRIGVFGSWARGDAGPSSDVDLIVEFDHPIGLRFMEFADEIERVLGRKADILTSEGVNTIRVPSVKRSIMKGVRYVEEEQ
jgi:hypothetical protein